MSYESELAARYEEERELMKEVVGEILPPDSFRVRLWASVEPPDQYMNNEHFHMEVFVKPGPDASENAERVRKNPKYQEFQESWVRETDDGDNTHMRFWLKCEHGEMKVEDKISRLIEEVGEQVPEVGPKLRP
jgi:hypothetical protein